MSVGASFVRPHSSAHAGRVAIALLHTNRAYCSRLSAGVRRYVSLQSYGSVLFSALAVSEAIASLHTNGGGTFAKSCKRRYTPKCMICISCGIMPKEPVGYGRRQSINGNCRGTTAKRYFMSTVLVLVAVCPLPPTPHPPILHQYLCKTLWGLCGFPLLQCVRSGRYDSELLLRECIVASLRCPI